MNMDETPSQETMPSILDSLSGVQEHDELICVNEYLEDCFDDDQSSKSQAEERDPMQEISLF